MFGLFKKKQNSSQLAKTELEKTEPTVKYDYKVVYEFTTTLGEKFTKTWHHEMPSYRIGWMLCEHGTIDCDSDTWPAKTYRCKYIVDYKQISWEKTEVKNEKSS